MDQRTKEGRHQKQVQDPHNVREVGESSLASAIGRAVREARKQKRITLADLSQLTGISTSMLSKIENGSSSPSIASLHVLANSLDTPITTFFRRFEQSRSVVHTPAGEGHETERTGTRSGHQYNLLGHLVSNSSGVVVEPYLITLTTKADRFPVFQHAGVELLYFLEGEVDYRHGDSIYALKPGDTLFFEADAPHGPREFAQIAGAIPVDHLVSAAGLGLMIRPPTGGLSAELNVTVSNCPKNFPRGNIVYHHCKETPRWLASEKAQGRRD